MSEWPLRKLGDVEVCLLNPKKKEVASIKDDTLVSFVPMARVDDVSGGMDVSEVKRLGEVRKGYTYFAEGDVVFAKITPCMENGKSAIARNLMNGIGFGTTEFHVLRPGPLTIPEWLHLFVRDREFREEAKKNMYGAAGQQRVPVDFLREATIPIPPLAEQRRIVARIEELTSRAEEARKLRQEAVTLSSQWLIAVVRREFDLLAEHHFGLLGELASIIGGSSLPEDVPPPDGNSERVGLMKVADMNSPGNEKIIKGCKLETTFKEAKKRKLRILPVDSIVFPKRGGNSH